MLGPTVGLTDEDSNSNAVSIARSTLGVFLAASSGSGRSPYAPEQISSGAPILTAEDLQRKSGGGSNEGDAGSFLGSTPKSAPTAIPSLNDPVSGSAATPSTTPTPGSSAASASTTSGAPTAETTPVQAVSAAATVTLINAAPVTQNPDGSTSVFGVQGNAIENYNSAGVTVFADSLATANVVPIPVWYAPADNAQYFQNILDNPHIFSTVAGGIAVFKMYGQMASWPDATLQAFFTFLSQNNIKLGIEAGALVASPGQPGYGIEGFAAPGDLVALVTRIQSLGGTLSYVGWDEPLYYGNISTGYYTVDQLATQAALSASEVRAIFPSVQIGDIEPVASSATDAAVLQAWFTAYAQAAKTPLSFFQADLATWTPGWQAELAGTITMVHANDMSIGVVIDGVAAADTDDAWATQAVANAQLILSDPVLRPDYLIVQSWQSYPSEAGTPGVAGTLASVAADVAASEPAALAIPATAQYNTAGFLQSVTWTGGWEALRNGNEFEVLSPTGSIVSETAWGKVQKFAFDPNTATVSLTTLVLASAAGAVPIWQSETSSIGVGANGIAFTAPVTSGSALTLALASSSQTGFAGSGITNKTAPTLTGTAAPYAVVALQVDGTSIGSATGSSTGAWSYTFGTALSSGAHVVQATVTNSTTGAITQQKYVVSVDTATPTASTLALAAGSDSGYPGDDITDVAQPIFTGVADPFTEISLAVDGTVVATTETSAAGQWSYALNVPLAVGTHTVTATAINPAGTSAAPATMQLTIDTAAQEAAVINYDPLFDTAWYLLNHPAVAASGANPYTQFTTVGWKMGYDPSPFFSISYYINTYPAVAAAGTDPLIQFEQSGWLEGNNPAPNINTDALEKSVPNIPAGEDPVIADIQSLEYSDAICTAVPNSKLTVSLLHDTGSSAADDITDDPTLAITADPGATLAIAIGSAAPATVTIGSSGSWSYGYAPASLAPGSYAVAVTETGPGGATSVATLDFTLLAPPTVTAVGRTTTGAAVLFPGNVATITLTMSETVQVTGHPTLTLSDGGAATYLSGSGSKTLTFTYTVAAGQNTSALEVTGVNLPAGASVVDSAGNAADFAMTVSALSGPVVIESQLPGTGANVTLAGGSQVTATQGINGYSVAMQGTSAANASAISATSAILGGQFTLSVTGAGSIAQFGSLAAIGGVVNEGTIVTQKGSAGGAATLAISISNTPSTTGTVAVPGVLYNAGTIDAGAGSTIHITTTTAGNMLNSGNLISDGMMFLGTSIAGAGEIVVGNTLGTSGTLEVQGTIAASESILLNAGTLTIDHLGSFLAAVTNFNMKDEIALPGVTATSVTYSGGALLLNGGSDGVVHLQPATGTGLTTGSFVLGHTGGATIITL